MSAAAIVVDNMPSHQQTYFCIDPAWANSSTKAISDPRSKATCRTSTAIIASFRTRGYPTGLRERDESDANNGTTKDLTQQVSGQHNVDFPSITMKFGGDFQAMPGDHDALYLVPYPRTAILVLDTA